MRRSQILAHPQFRSNSRLIVTQGDTDEAVDDWPRRRPCVEIPPTALWRHRFSRTFHAETRFDRPLRLARTTKELQTCERKAASMRWISRSRWVLAAHPPRRTRTRTIGR